MSSNRITKLALGVIFSLLLLWMPAHARVQNRVQNSEATNCSVKKYELEKATLPVANTDEEYKTYCGIVALQSPQDQLTQAQLFLETHKESDLRFPIYQNMVTSAIRLNNSDLAFDLGRRALVEFPDHVLVMTQLGTVASNQMLVGNYQY